MWTDPTILYASTHQMPLYPGTGAADEAGVGNIVNVPLYRDSSRYMNEIAAELAAMAAPALRIGPLSFTWRSSAKAGLAAALGVAATWSDGSDKAADTPPQRSRARRKPATKSRKTSSRKLSA